MKRLLYILIVIAVFQAQVRSQSTGVLTVNFTTKAYSGSYSPKHILAVWVVNGNGAFVKTLMSYYSNTKYVPYLTNWKSATSTYDRTDAITGATLSAHGNRSCTWNGKNVSGVTQPDGNYTVWIEYTESNTTGKYTSFTFTKGNQSVSLTPTATTYITGISSTWSPTASPVNDAKNDAVKIYPDPVISAMYVNGNNVRSVEIYSILGNKVKTYKTTTLNLSGLASGEYLAKVYSNDGISLKRFVKL